MTERHRKPTFEDIIFWLLILCGIGLAWMLIKGLINIVVRLMSQAKPREFDNETLNHSDHSLK